MVKAVDKTMVIGEIRLMEKRGGRSGEWRQGMKVVTSVYSDPDLDAARSARSNGFGARSRTSTIVDAPSREERLRELPDADVAFLSQLTARRVRRGPPPALDPEPGGRRRQPAVPGPSRQRRDR